MIQLRQIEILAISCFLTICPRSEIVNAVLSSLYSTRDMISFVDECDDEQSPVTAAETSFSKLKLIKRYLPSSMSQSRLSNLAIISIENEEAKAIDRDDLIKKFASAYAGERVNSIFE